MSRDGLFLPAGQSYMEKKSINALLIEDNRDDAVLIQRYLSHSRGVKYNVTHFDRLADGLECLKSVLFDVILLDLVLPDGPMGLETFEKVYAQAPHVPIIVLTGHDDDELAVASVQKGAQDYLVKDQVTGSVLGRSIQYAIERKKLLIQLEHSATEIKQLRGFLPICMNCKKIRDDKGYWTQLEIYISSHSEAEFSHGMCPECAEKLYPAIYKKGAKT
jgi:DNA-binding NtrC family response regulator